MLPISPADLSSTAAAAVETLKDTGMVILPEVLTVDEVEQVRQELKPWLRQQRMGRNDFEGLYTERVYALLAKSDAAVRLVEHPLLIEILNATLPPNYLLSALIAIKAHPGETPQRPHRDDSSGNLGLADPSQWFGISAMWAIDAFTPNNGATELVPGSHRWSRDRLPAEEDFVTAAMPAGSLLVFLGNLIHRGGANRSSAPRLGITPQYCAPFLRQIENMVLSVPPDRAAQLPDRVQSMIGYNVIDPGFMGYVDGMHPRRMLDPAYRGRHARGEIS